MPLRRKKFNLVKKPITLPTAALNAPYLKEFQKTYIYALFAAWLGLRWPGYSRNYLRLRPLIPPFRERSLPRPILISAR